jgi:arsenate reductase
MAIAKLVMDNNMLDRSLDSGCMKKKVLVLCTGNSIRSQMAEGFLKKYRKSWYIESAGTFPVGLSPLAVEVMAESGIDISKNSSKSVSQFISSTFDLVITVCDNARRSCPTFTGDNMTRYIHWSFEDPSVVMGSKDKRLKSFRKTRDLIDEKINEFLKNYE